ncbi:MAG: DUF1848 domain-containing protein [Zoogloeaceae bacterium]|nr:DUF1848 domain-containing protein [Zoogloeaceae bacterium]
MISASRSTDIPAFYAKWFLHRLEKGHLAWINPFNQKPSYVSFKKTRVVVFWTKNPRPLMAAGVLEELDRRGIHYYFQYTLNDYQAEGFEPHVAALEKRIETFRELSARLRVTRGTEVIHRVVWRFDPMILGPHLTPEILVAKVKHIGDQIKGCTDKLVFSFLDLYRKTKRNLGAAAVEINAAERQEIVERLLALRDQWQREDGWRLTLATCAENGEYAGVEHNHCIDGELIRKLFGGDAELAKYLGEEAQKESKRQAREARKSAQSSLFGDEAPGTPIARVVRIYSKDSGQREECGCEVSKDIGSYDTCPHGCLYCYANASPEEARKNYKLLKKTDWNGESLLPKGGVSSSKEREQEEKING